MALEDDRKKALDWQAEVNNQIIRINAEIARLQKEVVGLRLEFNQLIQRLKKYSLERFQLYTQRSSIEHELVILLS